VNVEGGGLPRIRPYLSARPPGTDPEAAPGDAPDPVERHPRPRPFVLTSGRVGTADPDIELHTQVTACVVDPGAEVLASLSSEAQAIVMLCAEPLSVAEISARLRLHLGVTKILVGDLRAAGLLDVHVLDVASPHDPETILRVIHGLRAFT
jgi:hypothetical protein